MNTFRQAYRLILAYKIFVYCGLFFICIKLFLVLFFFKNSNFFTPDSYKYIELANRFFSAYLTRDKQVLDQSLSILPGYPAFLKLHMLNTFGILLSQFLIHLFISFCVIVIMHLVVPDSTIKTKFFAFLLSQIETSLFVYSFRILSEILFTLFFLLLVIGVVKILKYQIFNIKIILFTNIIVVCLIRPVGFHLCAAFLCSAMFLSNKKVFLKLLLITLSCLGMYATFNFVSGGIYTYSTLQNHYLLFYEGAGARSFTESIPLANIQSEELKLRIQALGDFPDPNTRDSYNFKRGLELILDNKVSFLKIHLLGVIKILFGPNKFEISQLLSDSERIKVSSVAEYLMLILAILTTGFIAIFGLLGMLIYFTKSVESKFIVIIFTVFLLGSSGPQAYGRFRAPISGFLVIFAVLAINWIWNMRKNMITR